jgi:hypothetical protein
MFGSLNPLLQTGLAANCLIFGFAGFMQQNLLAIYLQNLLFYLTPEIPFLLLSNYAIFDIVGEVVFPKTQSMRT